MNTTLRTLPCLLALFAGPLLATACSDDDANPNTKPAADAGDDDTGPFAPPADPGKGFWVTVSGEDLAVAGYDWTAQSLASGDPPAFVDGWAIDFEHVIVTVGKIRVNADPDKDPANPKDVGALVASAEGPFAVDVTLGGDVTGKSGEPDERTVPIAAFPTKADGSDFDPTARYAFGYDFVAASASAKIVNLDAEGLALYERAKAEGWSMIYAGTATYKGPAPEVDTAFAKLPKQVKFTLGFKNPSSYENCQNTDLQQVGGEFPRGVQSIAGASTTVQITLHTDHTFWNKLNVEGTPLHFDPIAAQASTYGDPESTGEVDSADLVDVDVTGFKTKAGDPLPARSLVPDYAAPGGQLKFDANGTRFSRANSFASYLAYAAASGGHMNANGECEITNHFEP